MNAAFRPALSSHPSPQCLNSDQNSPSLDYLIGDAEVVVVIAG
jgi:hypothetical protein